MLEAYGTEPAGRRGPGGLTGVPAARYRCGRAPVRTGPSAGDDACRAAARYEDRPMPAAWNASSRPAAGSTSPLTRYVYRADRVKLAHEVASIPEKYQDAESG